MTNEDDFAVIALMALAKDSPTLVSAGFKKSLLPSPDAEIEFDDLNSKRTVKAQREWLQKIYDYIIDYQSKYQKGPSWHHLRQLYSKDIELPAAKKLAFGPEEIVALLIDNKKLEVINTTVFEIGRMFKGEFLVSPDKGRKVVDQMRNCVNASIDLVVESADKVETFSTDDIKENYRMLANGELKGIPLKFVRLSQPFNHLQAGYPYGIIGAPGVKKTFILSYFAGYIATEQNKKVLLFSSEMHALDLKRRIASMMAGVNYDGVIKGKLDREQRRAYYAWMKSEEADRLRENLYVAGPTSCQSLIELDRHLAEHNIEVACVDTIVNLASPDREGNITWVQVDNLMRNLRPVLFRRKVACLYTSHFNRSGNRKRGGIAHGDAFMKWSAFMWSLNSKSTENIVFTSFKARDASNNQPGLIYRFDVAKALFDYVGEHKIDNTMKGQNPMTESTVKSKENMTKAFQ